MAVWGWRVDRPERAARLSEWVVIVRLEAEADPGSELVTVLKERFGQSVRTLTQTAWLYDQTRAVPPPVGKPPSQTTTLPRARGVR